MTLEEMKDAIIQADTNQIYSMDSKDQWEAIAFLIEERLSTLSESVIREMYQDLTEED
jgi:hypothetical protein